MVGLFVALHTLVRMRVLGINMPGVRGKAIAGIILALGVITFWVLLLLIFTGALSA